MTGLSQVFDAATPPPSAPPGSAGVLGYTGRPGKTPHVWTEDEWARFKKLTQFPAWVPDLTVHAGTEAALIIASLRQAGFHAAPASLSNPHGYLAVVIDYETAGQAEAPWHAHLADALGHAGYDALAYGSLSTVMTIGAAHAWTAAWDGNHTLEPGGMTVHAHQYAADVPGPGGALVDYSVADPWLMARGLHRA